MTFSSLGLSAISLQAIEAVGYYQPTPIQIEAIPLILQGHDIFGCAQTGTGKTASFVLPILDLLCQGRSRARLPRVLVLVPTRELAHQVCESFETLGQGHKLKLTVLIGGESMGEQEKKMGQGVDVIIATPGRLLDIIQRGKLLMTGIQYLVIDEADHMLDLGFIPDVNKILTFIPPKHQTLFFSATVSGEIQKLSQAYLKSPKEICITPASSTSQTIEQWRIDTKAKEKRIILCTLIQTRAIQSAIIFCNRKSEVSLLTASLKRHGFKAEMMHGDLLQSERTKTLELFKKKEVDFLVASDVAARGIDVEDLPYVINFDVPNNAEEYVHRIGRTGRAGKTGVAYTLVSDTERKKLKAIETLIQKPLEVFHIALKENETRLKDLPLQETVKSKPKRKEPLKRTPPKEKEAVLPKERSFKTATKPVNDERKSIASSKKNVLPVYGFGSEVPAFFNLQWGSEENSELLEKDTSSPLI